MLSNMGMNERRVFPTSRVTSMRYNAPVRATSAAYAPHVDHRIAQGTMLMHGRRPGPFSDIYHESNRARYQGEAVHETCEFATRLPWP